MLTRQGQTLMSIQHAFTSNNGQGNIDGLNSLSHALRKLQSDVNSCLTEILQEITDSQQQGKRFNNFLSQEAEKLGADPWEKWNRSHHLSLYMDNMRLI